MKIRSPRSLGARDFSGATTDISFLLIIFFLVSAVFVSDRGLFLSLPEPEQEPRELGPDKLILVEIRGSPAMPGGFDGLSWSVDGSESSRAGLRSAVAALLAAKRPEAVIVAAGDDVPYAAVLEALESARSAGATMFSVVSGERPLPVEVRGAEGGTRP